MHARLRRRAARCEDLGLDTHEYATLARLGTPPRIQAFVNAIPANHETGGETLHSVRNVLRFRVAHCMEGALVAACALWIQGEVPLLLHLDCAAHDHPHVVAVFRRGRAWGAISKSNGAWLRYREPVYRDLRELAMSYFHEFFDRLGYKTLRSYGTPLDLSAIDPGQWVTGEAPCWAVHERLVRGRHRPLLSAGQVRVLSRRDRFERTAARHVEYPRPT